MNINATVKMMKPTEFFKNEKLVGSVFNFLAYFFINIPNSFLRISDNRRATIKVIVT
jgi:hypothetical protein